MSFSRIAIGTAQFGLDYGITNSTGMVPTSEVTEILSEAEQAGIHILDTAAAYGSAEDVLGANAACSSFRVVTKINATDKNDVGSEIKNSSLRLKCNVLNTVLLHDAEIALKDMSVWGALVDAVSKGLVDKVGISVYAPTVVDEMIEACDKNGFPVPDVIQVPLNVFDQRCLPYLSKWRAHGIEIHARSLYLQGAAFFTVQSLPPYLEKLAPQVQVLNALAQLYSVPIAALLLAYGFALSQIGCVVIGFDGLQRFRDTLILAQTADELNRRLQLEGSSVVEVTECLRVDDETLINPTKWKGKA